MIFFTVLIFFTDVSFYHEHLLSYIDHKTIQTDESNVIAYWEHDKNSTNSSKTNCEASKSLTNLAEEEEGSSEINKENMHQLNEKVRLLCKRVTW